MPTYLLQQGKGLASTNIECKKLWGDFLKNKEINHPLGVLYSRTEIWRKMLIKSSKYINKNKIYPRWNKNNSASINTIAVWLRQQNNNYKNNKSLLKDPDIKKEWIKFVSIVDQIKLLNTHILVHN